MPTNRNTTSREHTLDLLRHNSFAGITTHRMSHLQDQPEASIRRNIQELRAEGHDIVWGNGFYRYFGMVDSQQPVQQAIDGEVVPA